MEKRLGKIPEVRFPEFKDPWEHKRLSELLSEAKKLNIDLKYDKDEVLSVSGEMGIVNQIEHLGRSYAGESVHNYGVVEVGDIVYTKSPLKANPFGIIKLNKGKAGIVSTLYAVYKVKEKNAVGEFLDYYFSLDTNTNRYLRPLVKKGAKNDMKINNAYVLHDRVYTPTTAEQKRIASFFDVLDKRIAQLKKKKALLEDYKKGVMQKIFSQELRFKDENGKEFPKWNIDILGNLTVILRCGIASTPTYVEKGIPFLSSQNVTSEGEISLHKYNYVSQDYYNFLSKKHKLNKGDILYSRVGASYGNAAIFPFDGDYGVYVSLTHIRPNEKLNNYFLKNLLNSDVGKMQAKMGVFQGGGVPNLNVKVVEKFKIEFPSLPEQIKIANFLSAIDKKINHCQTQIEQTKEYKKGLIQQMFCL